MFAEWTDDNDIDNYYDDVAFLNIEQAPSSVQYMRMPVEPSVGEIINKSKNVSEAIVPTTDTPIEKKDSFDVTPNSVFIDGHGVGSQPKINILRSADRETYRDKLQQLSQEWIYVILIAIAFFMLSMMYINVKMQLCSTQMSFEMLMRMYCSREQMVMPSKN